jgi:hypothetical protein
LCKISSLFFIQVKGLVDPENISHNASDYDQHLSSASPTIPPSDSEIEFGNIMRRKFPNPNHHHHHHHHLERRASITEKFDENESDSAVHRDDFDVSDRVSIRPERLSPILSGGDQSRKRRKDSICDTPLPQSKRRNLSDSQVSTLVTSCPSFNSPKKKMKMVVKQN